MNLVELASMTELEAREWFEKIRWPDGPVCSHCGELGGTRLQAGPLGRASISATAAGANSP